MNPHYVCPVCAGVSDVPKLCETEGCRLKGQPLKECNCDDNNHMLVLDQDE